MIKLPLLEAIRNGSGKLYMIYVTSKKENPHFHTNNDDEITNPISIANYFKNYF